MQIQRSKCDTGEHTTATGSSGNRHDRLRQLPASR